MTTTDTLLAELADVLDRAAKLAAEMAETLRAADGPPHEMRLPGGRVAYTTMRCGEIVPGMWVDVVDGNDLWRQVESVMLDDSDEWVHLAMSEWCAEIRRIDDKIKVASTVDAARMAAERQAQQAEAYDQACEARS